MNNDIRLGRTCPHRRLLHHIQFVFLFASSEWIMTGRIRNYTTMPYAGRICVLLSGNTLVHDSTISRVNDGCCVSTTAGESAQHTISVFTAPLITFIITDDTHKPMIAPILIQVEGKIGLTISATTTNAWDVQFNHS